MATREEPKTMHYPATVEGYFDDEALARAAADELEALDLGPLPRAFVKVSVINREVRAADLADTPPAFLDRLFAMITPAKPPSERIVRNDYAVLARGTPQHMAEARSVLERHGARDIKEYDAPR